MASLNGLHRSLYLLSTLFLFQYTVLNYMLTPKSRQDTNYDFFELIKCFQMILLTLFMIILEFRSSKTINLFQFTESHTLKSIFLLIVCGLLYDKKAFDDHSQLRIILGCIAILAMTMLIISPFTKKSK